MNWGVLTQLLELLINWIKRIQRNREQHETQVQYDKVNEDPIAWFDAEFGRVQSTPGSKGTPETRTDSGSDG